MAYRLRSYLYRYATTHKGEGSLKNYLILNYSTKPYSNPSGPMAYNSGALLPPPTLKFWNDSTLRSCASLWTSHGTSLIHSSEGTSAALQSKKKYAVTALTTDVFACFCLLICLTDSNKLFFFVILVLSYLLVSLVPY
jgi:hypothetical protein